MSNFETKAQMFAALSATNEAILKARSAQELYRQVCEAAVEGGGFRTAEARQRRTRPPGQGPS